MIRYGAGAVVEIQLGSAKYKIEVIRREEKIGRSEQPGFIGYILGNPGAGENHYLDTMITRVISH